IELDSRTEPLQRVLRRVLPDGHPPPSFHWLPSPDLAGHSVACVLAEEGGRAPAIAVGLGADLGLVGAMYRALLEACGVAQLGRIVLVQRETGQDGPSAPAIDPTAIHDLDSNVVYYARREHAPEVRSRFPHRPSVRAAALPPDGPGAPEEAVRALVARFRETG